MVKVQKKSITWIFSFNFEIISFFFSIMFFIFINSCFHILFHLGFSFIVISHHGKLFMDIMIEEKTAGDINNFYWCFNSESICFFRVPPPSLFFFSILRRGICPTKSNINWHPPLRGSLWGGGMNFFHFFDFYWSYWPQNLFLKTIGHFCEKKNFFSMENQKWQKKSVLKFQNLQKIGQNEEKIFGQNFFAISS